MNEAKENKMAANLLKESARIILASCLAIGLSSPVFAEPPQTPKESQDTPSELDKWAPEKSKLGLGKSKNDPKIPKPKAVKDLSEKTRHATCSTLQKWVGPKAKVNEGDTILVYPNAQSALLKKHIDAKTAIADKPAVLAKEAAKFTGARKCKISKTLEIGKPVTIKPATPVALFEIAPLYDLIEDVAKDRASKLGFTIACATPSAACISVTVPNGKTVGIEAFKFEASAKPLQIAPFIDAISGSVSLKMNHFKGATLPDKLVAHPTAISLKGSGAVLKDNIFENTHDTIAFFPISPTPVVPGEKSYVFIGNIFNGYGAAAIRVQPLFASARNENPGALVAGNRFKTSSLGSASPRGVVLSNLASEVSGNRFEDDFAGTAVTLDDGEAVVKRNWFENPSEGVSARGSAKVQIHENLFEEAGYTVEGVDSIIEAGGPIPTYNLCLNQSLESNGIEPGVAYDVFTHDDGTVDVNPATDRRGRTYSDRKIKSLARKAEKNYKRHVARHASDHVLYHEWKLRTRETAEARYHHCLDYRTVFRFVN